MARPKANTCAVSFVAAVYLTLLPFLFGQSQATRYAGETYGGATTIQAAINDAGTTGTVIIPAAYGHLTETFTNSSNIPILDLRRATKTYGNVANVMDYGAVCDDSTDDTSAIQTAVTKNPDGAIWVPGPSLCRVNGTISSTAGTAVWCSNQATAGFREMNTGVTLFDHKAQSSFLMFNCQLVSTSKQTAGAFISIDGPAGAVENSSSLVSGVRMTFPWIGIKTIKANGYTFHDNIMTGIQSTGIFTNNTNNADSGGEYISGNIFSCDSPVPANSAGILQYSSFGNISLNKFFKCTYALWVNIASNTSGLGQITFNSNRVEQMDKDALLFARQSGYTGTLGGVVINDNFFGGGGTESISVPCHIRIAVPSDGDAAWTSNYQISGNIHYLSTKGTAECFDSALAGGDSSVGPETLIAGAGTSRGIYINGNTVAATVTIHQGRWASVSTPFSGFTTPADLFNPGNIAAGVQTTGAALTSPLSIPNNSHLAARNAGSSAWKRLIGLNSSDQVVLSADNQQITTAAQIQSTLASGTTPFSITSTTPVANLTTVPVTYNSAGTQQTSVHIVVDSCTLGTSCSVTLSGSAAFTSSSSYQCAVTDKTAANAALFNPTSGSAFTLTGTGTDVLGYVCVGN